MSSTLATSPTLKPNMFAVPSSLGKALRVVQPLFVVAGFVLFALLLRGQWDALAHREWHVNGWWLALSGVLVVGGWLLEILLWQRLIARFGYAVAYAAAVRIWFSSTIVRYIPGNVWQPLSLTVRAGGLGVSVAATLAALSLFHVVHVLAVGPVVAAYVAVVRRLPLQGTPFAGLSPWWAIALLVPMAAPLARPNWMIAIVNAALTRLGRPALPQALDANALAGPVAISIVAWALFATAFAALAAAIAPAPLTRSDLTTIAVAYPVAFAIGFVSFITPSGLVVREGVLVVLLTPIVGRDTALIVALAMRLWELLLDGVVSLAANIAGVSARADATP